MTPKAKTNKVRISVLGGKGVGKTGVENYRFYVSQYIVE